MLRLIFVLLIVASSSADDYDSKKKCTILNDEPSYQPNIYLCSDGYACCRVYGQPACCSEDIRLKDEITSFCLFFGVGLTALLVAWTIQWYFDDDNPSDLIYAADVDKKPSFYTEYSRKNEVEDPIFGPVIHEETPKYAGYKGYHNRTADRAHMDDILRDLDDSS